MKESTYSSRKIFWFTSRCVSKPSTPPCTGSASATEESWRPPRDLWRPLRPLLWLCLCPPSAATKATKSTNGTQICKEKRRYTLIEQLCSFLEYVENKHNSLFNTDYTEYWIEKITNYFEDPHGGSYRVPWQLWGRGTQPMLIYRHFLLQQTISVALRRSA